MTTFGDRLRTARTSANLTQEQLGFAVGVSKQSVSDWENGRQFPNPQAWPLLKHELRVSLDHLICGDGPGRGRRVQEDAAKYETALHPDLRRLVELGRDMGPKRLKALLVLMGD